MAVIQLKVGGAVQDMSALKISLERLSITYNVPRELVFRQDVRHHEAAFDEEDEVELTADGVTRFLGNVVERELRGEPGSESVGYRAVGLAARASAVDVADEFGRPHRVYNADEEDADEYVATRSGMTIGEIMADLFDAYSADLEALGFGETPFVAAELEAMAVIARYVTFDNLTFDMALVEALQYQPGFAWFVDPADRRYRFVDLENDLGPVTVTIDSDQVSRNVLRPSTERRYTAVEIAGAHELAGDVAYLSAGDLEEYWNGALEADWTPARANGPETTDGGSITSSGIDGDGRWFIEDSSKSWGTDLWAGGEATVTFTTFEGPWGNVYAKLKVVASTGSRITFDTAVNFSGYGPISYEVQVGYSDYAYVYRRYRVADPAKRTLAREILASDREGLLPAGVKTFAPLVQVLHPTWRIQGLSGSYTGYAWMVVPATIYWSEGVFLLAHPATRLDDDGAWTRPLDLRFVFTYRTGAMTARYPASGYTGTAYTGIPGFTSPGIERVKRFYDETFSDPADLGRYETLAAELLKPLKNVQVAGEVRLETLDWDLAGFTKKVNVAASGGVTTHWESLGAVLAGLVYDFEAEATRLRLATDPALVGGEDYEALKERLLLGNLLRGLERRLNALRARLAEISQNLGSVLPGSGSPGGMGIDDALQVVRSIEPVDAPDSVRLRNHIDLEEGDGIETTFDDTDPDNPLLKLAVKVKDISGLQFDPDDDDRMYVLLKDNSGLAFVGGAGADKSEIIIRLKDTPNGSIRADANGNLYACVKGA